MVNLDYLYNPEAARKYFDKNYFVDKKLGFQVIEHGTILPYKNTPLGGLLGALGGIIDNEGKFVGDSFVTHSKADKSYNPSQESIQHSSETVIYLGYFYPVWGHVITDNIRRLWFLKSDAFRKEFKNCPLVYIKWGSTNLEDQSSFKRLLEILEVDVDKLKEISQPTQFEKIIMPDSSINVVSYFTNEYKEIIEHMRNFALKHRTPTSSKKVYYFHGRRGFGEEWLAEYFKSKGYEIVSPEKLTIDEQLNLLINAESFASTCGSSSHNSIFLHDDTEVILIVRRHFYPYQKCLDQVHSVNTNYIDSSLSIFYTRNGPFCYIVSPQLKRFFGDKFDGYEEEDFKNFLQYVENSIRKGFVVDPSTREYYAPILENFMEQLKQHEDLITAYNMPPRWEQFRPTLTYQTHLAKKSWGVWQNEEQISGSLDNNLDIQAVRINFPGHKVFYAVYFNDKEGWSEEVTNGEQAGTTGKRKSIMGIKIRLDEAGTKEFNILYRVHKFDGEWTDWAKNGECIYSYGQKLNALQIKLELKGK